MERNITLDYFKILLTILVVTIHCPMFHNYPAISWELSNGIARVAVPCFFVINGYFIYDIITDKNKVKKYLKHILTIYITWMIIYYPFYMDEDLDRIIIYIFGGNYHHLWYVAHLMIASILLYLSLKYIQNDKILLYISLALFFLGYLLQKLDFAGFAISYFFSRNFLFMGFPFLFIGYYLKKIDAVNTLMKNNIVNITLIVILLTVLLIEAYLSYIFKANRFDFYFILIFLCPLLVLFVLKNSKYKKTGGDLSKLATGIYLIHPLIVFKLHTFINVNSFVYFYLVIVISTLLSYLILKLNKRIKIFI